jgi:crotonobetaine/carnitine-CoA ligase
MEGPTDAVSFEFGSRRLWMDGSGWRTIFTLREDELVRPEPLIEEILGELPDSEPPSFIGLLRRMHTYDPAYPAIQAADGRISYGQLLAMVGGAVKYLKNNGVRKGDCVAYMSFGHQNIVATILAAALLGARLAPCHQDLRGDILAEALHRRSAKVLILDDAIDCDVASLLSAVPDLQTVAYLRSGPYAEAIRAGLIPSRYLSPDAPALAGPDDPAILLSTSGTSGAPKIVIETQSFATNGLIYSRKLHWTAPIRMYIASSWSHGSAIMQMALAFWNNGTVIIPRRFSVSRFWADVELHAITHSCLIGSMSAMLFTGPDRYERSRTIDVLTTGMEKDLWIEFGERFGVRISELYSATDLDRCTIYNPNSTYPPGSIGRPFRDFDVRVVNDHGDDVHCGDTGELVCRPLHRMPSVRYLGDVVRSQEKVLSGWIRSGDLVRQDVDGNYYFVGRIGDRIRRRGVNVSSQSIEELLARPEIAEIVAFAVPSKIGEDDVKVVAVPRAKGELTALARNFSDACKSVPAFMRPRYVEFIEELPKTSATGRVKKEPLKLNWRTPNTYDLEQCRFLGDVDDDPASGSL